MELNDAIYGRRAIRHFSERPVNEAAIREAIRAATRAPSALNLQPWAFAIFHGRRRLAAMSERCKAHVLSTLGPAWDLDPRRPTYSDPDYNVFHGASTLVVIYATNHLFRPVEDCCLAAENLMLAACGLGLGTCPVGFSRPWFDLAEVKSEFGIPERYSAAFPVVLGHAADRAPDVPRKEPEIACWNWSEE